MIRQLFAFEFSYQKKQWALLIAIALFFLSGIQIGAQAFAPDLVNYNAPYQITYYVSLFTLGSVFATMFFVISGVLREQEHHTESLIFCSGIKKYQFFISRFLGVFLFSVLAFSPILLGIIIGTHSFGLTPERLSPFSLFPYIWTWLVFILPNIFICTSILFSVSLFSKNRFAVYAGAVFIYVGYFITASVFGSPILAGSSPSTVEQTTFAALMDPFGITAFMEQSQYWTPAQKNILNVSLSGNFLLNRIIWFLFGIVLLSLTYNRFSFTFSGISKQKKQKKEKKAEKPNLIYSSIAYQTGNFPHFWNSYKAQFKMGIKHMAKSIPFWAIVLVWAFIVVSELYFFIYESGSYSEKMYPTSYLLAGAYQEPLFLLGLMLVVFYSGEWIWKEHTARFNSIIDATPVSNTSVFLSKVSVLAVIPALLIVSGIVLSVAFQIHRNFLDYDFTIYLSTLYFYGLPLMFFILLAVFIQSFLPNKYLGMLVTGLLALGLSSNLSFYLGIEHPLLRMGAIPSVVFTGMSGTGNYAKPFHLLGWHWFTLGLILLLLSFKVWNRGSVIGVTENLKKLSHSWSLPKVVPLLALLILFSVSTGYIFYKTNIESEYMSSSEQLDLRADYEQRYKSFEHLDRLFPAFIKSEMDIFPDNQKYRVKAEYLLVNKHNSVIDTVLITPRGNLTSMILQNGTLIEHNEKHNTYLYRFENSIQPGDTISMEFEVEKQQTGLSTERDVVQNGTYIHLRDFSPIMGYRNGLEIRNNKERRKRGLPDRKPEIVSEADLTTEEIGYGKIHVETILSTSNDQIGISIGDLIEKWSENHRNYYHFKTSTPVSPAAGYFSGNYTVDTDTHSEIKLEHYYHPEHSYNSELIMESMKATLEYAEAEFGDYPFHHLRIVEIPAHWGFGGYAHPGTISMVEDNLYLIDERDTTDFSLVAKRTIHEVAHQWWGHRLSPKNTSGAGIFVEGFSKYTEAVVMEKIYGKRAVFQLSETAKQQYFVGRSYSQNPEQPLYLEQGEGYILYGKSYVIMLALKELIGEEKVNGVLKTLIDRHESTFEATLTSLEFLEELYKVTPAEYHSLIDDWFKKITSYDLSVLNADYKKENGLFTIEIDIEALKFEHIDGLAKQINMDEPIQIGAFSRHPSNASDEEILYLESHTITEGTSTIKITVDKLPRYVAIDPYGTRLDMIRNDNWAQLSN